MRHTTVPLPDSESRTKFTLTVVPVVPRANVVVACPALFTVVAVVLSPVWSTTGPFGPPPEVTVNTAVATLLLVSMTVIVWFPDRPVGMLM